MPELRLLVGGNEYAGWKTVRVTRAMEAIAGGFELSVSDRWPQQNQPWQITEEDECSIVIDGETLITGYVDKVGLSFGKEEHSLTVSGRDRAGDLVDCSALLDRWEFLGISLLALAKKLTAPFGIEVAMQEGLQPPAVPGKLTVDPGESAFDALERACRLAGVLPISDGLGDIVLTRAGSSRATTPLVEGENVLQASADFDATGKFRRYVVMGQHPGNDEFAGDSTARVRGEASDPNVSRSWRTLVIRADGGVTPAIARRRAEWEAKARAARGDHVTVRVQGWKQSDGKLWSPNALVDVRLPYLGARGELLISRVVHSLDDRSGTTTELSLVGPDAFLPQPQVPQAVWKELTGGV